MNFCQNKLLELFRTSKLSSVGVKQNNVNILLQQCLLEPLMLLTTHGTAQLK